MINKIPEIFYASVLNIDFTNNCEVLFLLKVSVNFINTLYLKTIDQVGRVFANCPVGLGSISGRVIPKTLKVVLDTSLLNSAI